MAKSKKTSDAFDMADDIRKEVAAESVADACSTSVPAIYSLAKGDKGKSELQHAFCVLVSLFLRNWTTIARGDRCQSSISCLLFRRPLRRKEKNGTK